MSMIALFDTIKVAQAAAILLKEEKTQTMSRLRLLKLLYIADREHLQEFGALITGDRPVAMDHGPVLSHTYDLIKGDSPTWNQFMFRDGRNVELAADPGVGRLSEPEVEKLQAVSRRYMLEDDWAVAELTHGFEEWAKNQPPNGTMKPIPLDDLLEALDMLDDREELLHDAEGVRNVRALLNAAEDKVSSRRHPPLPG